MITNDLEFLISKAVDTNKADYAVITGVQIHNWGNDGTGAPTLEFIAPTTGYVVIDGERVDLNLQKVSSAFVFWISERGLVGTCWTQQTQHACTGLSKVYHSHLQFIRAWHVSLLLCSISFFDLTLSSEHANMHTKFTASATCSQAQLCV